MNKLYLASLRSASCYPYFRVWISVTTFVGYLVALAIAVSGSLSGFGPLAIIGGLLTGALVAVLTIVFQETAQMLADIADSSIEHGAVQRSLFHEKALAQTALSPQPAMPSESNSAYLEALNSVQKYGESASQAFKDAHRNAGDVISPTRIAAYIAEKFEASSKGQHTPQ
jgi:hypothetical protein